MLLSDKDYPFFAGDMKPGFAGGLVTKVKLSSLLDFALIPTWVYQSGSMESLTAVQIPMALQVGLGNVAKLNAERGIYTREFVRKAYISHLGDLFRANSTTMTLVLIGQPVLFQPMISSVCSSMTATLLPRPVTFPVTIVRVGSPFSMYTRRASPRASTRPPVLANTSCELAYAASPLLI